MPAGGVHPADVRCCCAASAGLLTPLHVGPVLAALQAWDPVVGLVVGSYQGCSEELHALAREVAEERARTEWRQMGARSEHEPIASEALRTPASFLRRAWAARRGGPVSGARRPRAGR